MKVSILSKVVLIYGKVLASNRVLIEMMMRAAQLPASKHGHSLGVVPRQIPMPHNLRFRKENLQISEKVNESPFPAQLSWSFGFALLIEPSLKRDADRASIIRSGMSPPPPAAYGARRLMSYYPYGCRSGSRCHITPRAL